MDAQQPFLTTDNPQEAAAAARRDGQLVVWVPRSVRSKETLLLLYADVLRFPRYFRRNWDAFEECLNDLHWLPEQTRIAVVHEQMPFGAGPNRTTYLSILAAAAQNRRDARSLEVVLPSA